MRVTNKMRFMPIVLILLLICMMAVPMTTSVVYAAETPVGLGTASTFGILAGTTITNTGSTTVEGSAGGNIGLHPGTEITGLAQMTVTGSVYLADTDGVALQAKNDLQAAYNDAAGRIGGSPIPAELDGVILTPGVYRSESSIILGVDDILTLDGGGDPNAVFIFQAGSTLTTLSGSEVVLTNGAQPCGVFWQVGSSATLGTNSTFIGHILAMESITATTGAEIEGQLLALDGAVTLDANTITNDACLSTSGSLSVTKAVQGINNVTESFSITVTGPNNYSNTQPIVAGSSYTWLALAPGTYTVSEVGLSGEWNASGTGQYEIEVGTIRQVTVTNTYVSDDSTNDNDNDDEVTTGDLTVRKVVSGELGDIILPSFEIKVTGPRDFSATRTILQGESYTWENLVPGTYTVTESRTGLSSEWRVSGEGTVQVRADQTAVKTITNAYLEDEEPTGQLTVTKVVSGNTSEMTLPLFGVTVTGPRDFSATRTFVQGESYTWEYLVPGTYTVTESRTGLSSEWRVSGEGPVQVTADQTALKTITNVYNSGVVPSDDTTTTGAEVVPVLGIVELPRTGGNPLLMIFIGLVLSGVGFLFRRK